MKKLNLAIIGQGRSGKDIHGKFYISEINPRFGGGYPFSHENGCNLPQAIVNWVKGENVPQHMLEAETGHKGYKELSITNI